MRTLDAFRRGQESRGREPMVFDWERAAKIIRERGAQSAGAGLQDDWEWTGGDIFRDGKPIPKEETYTYLASTWAKPELRVENEVVECFRMLSETPGWNENTYWPTSALKILEVGESA